MSPSKILNKQQIEAVKFGRGPLLIIAGAGTGKTTVITERIKHLILEKKINPSRILALTFTEKSAKELEERIDEVMPYGYTQMWISTFHSFCDRILRNEAIHIGLNPSYKLLSETEIILFLRKNIFKFELEYFRPLGNPYKFLQGMLQHFSRLKDEDVSPKQYAAWAQNQKSPVRQAQGKNQNDENKDEIKKNIELSNAYQIYEKLKIEAGFMDFSDLISNTLKLFRERKNILKQYQEQFKYILLDEFQDTNFAQNELAILLAGERKNINVVGDDDQAIYRWRGAAISNIIQFKKRFSDAKVITLIKNYRSTKEILDKSYLLIQKNNPDRLEVKEKVDKKLVSERAIKGNEIEFIFSDRVENEAEKVVKKIIELVEKKQIDYKDIAILVRANDHSQPFVRTLNRLSIPYQFLGPGQLFLQEEIKDLIAYLKVLYNFNDSTSLYRVLAMPIFKLEGYEISALLNYSKRKNLPLFEVIKRFNVDNNLQDEIFLNDHTKETIGLIFQMIKKHLNLSAKESAGQIIYYFLEESGYLKEIVNNTTNIDEKKSQNIAKFFDKLKSFETDHEDASIFTIVEWIDISMQAGESPQISNTDWSDINAVNILTIHSSKGLEFPVVFLVNLVGQRFPTRERKEQIPIPQELIKEILPTGDYHLEEERRLFYVGMTRAKDYLFLTAANFYGEGKRERKISPFVYETLGEDVVKKIISNQITENSTRQLNFLEWGKSNKEPQILNLKSQSRSNRDQILNPVAYLSYSQIQTFDICPMHYKLKYILKIPTPQNPALSFGTSVHSVLREFYQKIINKEKVKIDDILNLIEINWINEGYENRDHEIKALDKAKQILKNYLKNNLDKSSPIALEMPFQFFLKDKERGLNLKVGGRIDRVDKLSDKQIEIIDYKTGSNVPTEKALAEDKQLTFYALAATEVNNEFLNKKPEEVILSLYYLEKDKKLTTVRTKEQLSDAKKFILEKADEISKSDFACSHSILCKTCEYKMLCSVENYEK